MATYWSFWACGLFRACISAVIMGNIIARITIFRRILMSENAAAKHTPDTRGPVTLEAGDICIAASYSAGEVDIRRNSGAGRVLVLTPDLSIKAALWTDEEGLVTGVEYCPKSRILFVSDVVSKTVRRFSPDGEIMPSFPAMQGKPFGTIAAKADGSIVIGEHIKGDKMPFIGGGEIYTFDGEGGLQGHFAAENDPGKFGFHGVTSMILADDDRTAIYISETGRRVMQYDLAGDRQLDDLFVLDADDDKSTTGIAMTPAGEILLTTVYGVCLFSRSGELLKEFDIPKERGWSAIRLSADGTAFFVANFFTGRLEKRSLATGDVIRAVDTGLVYRLASIAEIS